MQAEGELKLGPELTTAQEADAPEPLCSLGDHAVKGCVSMLDDEGINVTKKEDVSITYKKADDH